MVKSLSQTVLSFSYSDPPKYFEDDIEKIGISSNTEITAVKSKFVKNENKRQSDDDCFPLLLDLSPSEWLQGRLFLLKYFEQRALT